VVIQPWEYGSIPRAWVEPLAHLVDELWVPSSYVRRCYIQGGVPADRVWVVPNGVDTERLARLRDPFPLQTRKRCKFLFVGGTIARKGIDLLLDAYTHAFTAADDVCLVIKDMGAATFYQGQTAQELIARCRTLEGPEIEYLTGDLGADEMAALYRACDCLVHPYRGEGFGLPIAEAMASGLPVVVTGHGAALDFCSEETAFLVPARLAPLPEARIGEVETIGLPWLAEPDGEALRHLLAYVAAHPDETRRKGQAGAAQVRVHFTWDRAVDAVLARLAWLRHQPIRRRGRGAASVTLPPRGTPGAPTCVSLAPPTYTAHASGIAPHPPVLSSQAVEPQYHPEPCVRAPSLPGAFGCRCA
jgi:glycosyltransferase involved in cell wall biosynthesis